NVSLEIALQNNNPVSKETIVRTTILDEETQVSVTEISASINQNESKTISQKLQVENPKFWSVETPKLYTAYTEILVNNKVVDAYSTPFGIRTFEFHLEKGFLLNGEQVKIKGVCLHHDLGPLGTAVNRRAVERQLEIMKNMGVNGIRTSHNPPTPELLDLCDQMGFIVMDESFDMWNNTKIEFDYDNDRDK